MKNKLIKLTLALAFILICIGTVSAASADENITISGDENDTPVLETEETLQDVSISGKVEKCSDGTPFPGVTVTATSSEETISTTTNAAGTYLLYFKSSSTNFQITASAPGHQPSTQEVTVLPGEDNIYLSTANFKLGMDTVYVTTTGNDITGDGTQANPYQTIGKGITEVNPDGTVNVADGTYYEHLVIDKNLNLLGQSQENTIIDGSNTGTPITIHSGATVSISLFTIQNANGHFGGGIGNGYGTLTVNRSTFINNTAQYGGAIFNAAGSNLNVIDCTFTNNHGIFGGGAIYDAEGTSTVTGSTFTNNLADYGGAIYTYGTVTVSDSTFTGNSATTYGGAIYNYYGYDYDATLTVTDSVFTSNTAPLGGAIHNYATLNLSGSTFSGNSATNSGGAIYNYHYCSADVKSSTFSGNSAYYGGAIENNRGTVTVSGTTISGNTATNYGGAIYNHGTLEVFDSTISGNTARYVGGISNDMGTLTANFNRIVGNSPTAIENDGGSVNAEYNWWGSNNPNFATLISGVVDYNPWLYMSFQADPTTIQQGETSTLTANFNHAYDGDTVTPFDPVIGHLPDGIKVTFTTDLGQVGSQTVDKPTVNGVATATLTGTDSGLANLSATLDDETLTSTVNIQAAGGSSETVHAQTVGMQETGTPISGIVLAILMVLSGFIRTQKKQ